MIVLVDTREQRPLWRPQSSTKLIVRRITLNVGDYTTMDLVKSLIIERKSPQDLYGTLTKGNRRFKREVVRAEEAGIKLMVYVECSRKIFLEKKFWQAEKMNGVTGDTLKKIINTFTLRYKIEFVWCKDRNVMAKKILSKLKSAENEKRKSGAKAKAKKVLRANRKQL